MAQQADQDLRPKAESGSPSGQAPEAGVRQWYMVAILTLAYVLSFLDRQSLALIVGPVKQYLNISDFRMSLLIGLSFVLLYTTLSIPAGYLADLYSRKFMIAGGIFLWSSMTTLCGFANSYWQLFLTRTGVGIGEAVLPPSAYSMIRDAFPQERRGRAFGLYQMGPIVGGGAALVVGATLLALGSSGALRGLPVLGRLMPWQVVLVIPGILGIPLALLMLTVREPARKATGGGEGAPTFGMAFAHFWKKRRFYLPLWGAMSLFSLAQGGWSGWLPTAVNRAWKVPLPRIGHTLGLIQIAIVPFGLLTLGWIMDRLTKRGHPDAAMRVVMVAAAISVASLVSLPWVANHRTAAVLYAIETFFYSSYAISGGAGMAQITPGHLMGKLTSAFFLVQNLLGVSLGPIVVAAIAAAWFKGPKAIGYAMVVNFTVAASLGIILYAILARELRRGEARP